MHVFNQRQAADTGTNTHTNAFGICRVFTQTGIAPETIVETARVIAGARPASLVHPGRHTTWYGDDTQRTRAQALLSALLGAGCAVIGLLAAVMDFAAKANSARVTKTVANQTRMGERRVDGAFIGQVPSFQ